MFTKQQFDGDIVRRYLPHSRLSSGSLLVDESTYETVRQKFVFVLLYFSLSLSLSLYWLLFDWSSVCVHNGLSKCLTCELCYWPMLFLMLYAVM